jgi:hypothetical protein
MNVDSIRQNHCRFCHTGTANQEIKQQVEMHGYYILQMEGCPSPAM